MPVFRSWELSLIPIHLPRFFLPSAEIGSRKETIDQKAGLKDI
jgi:hypothetical protein